MTKPAYTIELPAAVGRRVSRAARKEKKSPSALAAEALDWYLLVRNLPEETPTASEMRAIRRGRAAYKRGEFITLDELRRKETLAGRPNQARAKVS
jgi:predicted transcriptional regulator